MSNSITLRLDDDLFNALENLSKQTGKTKNSCLKEALKDYLQKFHMANTFDEELSDETLQDIKEYEANKQNNSLELTSLDELKQELNV